MGVDNAAVAKVTGFDTSFKDLRGSSVLNLPQHVALIGQGNTANTYSTTKRRVYSAGEVGTVYGFGSPLHLAAMELLPQNGDGLGAIPLTVFPLTDHGSGVVATGDITPSGTLSKATSVQIRVAGILSDKFTVPAGAVSVATFITNAIAACTAIINFPFNAANGTTKLNLTSKWKGLSANGAKVELIYDTTVGLNFAITQPAGGLNNPDVSTATNQFGSVWYTMAVNCLEQTDTTNLDVYSNVADGRWGVYMYKPLVFFTGSNTTVAATAYAQSNTRKTDRGNSVISVPGSPEFPFAIAARAVARMAKMADSNPPTDYGGLKLDTIIAGDDLVQWDYTTRDAIVKAGTSTTESRDGVVVLSDVVTFWHPTGEEPPAYRYVVDIVRLQNILFNLQLRFASPEWESAPLLPGNQVSNNPNARRESDAKGVICGVMDALGLAAIIADPDFSKKTAIAKISSQNPKRLDMSVSVKLSGNTNIKSFDLAFGFYFGA